MIATMTPDFIQHEPAETYHAKASENLSSHALADFRKSPWLFRKKQGGLIADEDRPAYVLGRATHVLILEGRQAFDDRYAIGGPVNPRTGNPYGSNTKAFHEWAAAQGKPVLTHDQVFQVEQLASGVAMNSIATAFLKSGIAEGVVRACYMNMACQIRMDWFAAERGLVDLKTCDDLTWFESDARRYGYAHQLAFYRAVLKEVAGEQFPVHIIAVEKREPFRCGVWRVGDDVLGIAQRENEDAILRLKRCMDKDHWPTGYESIRTFDYARQKAMRWWQQRSPDPMPDTAERAVEVASAGGVAWAERITVRSVSGEKYDRIVAHKLGPMPDPLPAHESCEYDPQEIPF